jgi:hypothetical protein
MGQQRQRQQQEPTILHISLMLSFSWYHFRTDLLVEETVEELEPIAGAVVGLENYSPGSSSLLLCGFGWLRGGQWDLVRVLMICLVRISLRQWVQITSFAPYR